MKLSGSLGMTNRGKPHKEWIGAHLKTPSTHLLEVNEEHYQLSSEQQIKEPRFKAQIVTTTHFILDSMDDDMTSSMQEELIIRRWPANPLKMC
jgi:hypothetical protein